MNETLKHLEAQSREVVRTGAGSVFVEYLAATVEQAKEELVNAKPEEVQGVQGFIKRTRTMINKLTTKPVGPQKNGAYRG